MTTGVGCVVYVDGLRAADGCVDTGELDPVILEGLTIAWGRGDTMSQPEVDTCSFSVLDPVGGGSFGATYQVGKRVDVLASGNAFPDPSALTFRNPGFELDAVTWQASAATAVRSTRRAHSGSYSLAVTPLDPTSSSSVLLAPGELQADGTNPDAWDTIPTTSAGQDWSGTVSVWLPAGASAAVQVQLFTGPYASAASPVGPSSTVVGTGAWQTISRTVTVATDARWVGLRVTLDPSGPSWEQVPLDVSWDELDPSLVWDELAGMYLDDVDVAAPSGVVDVVLVFSGRISDLSTSWDDSAGSPVIEVAAVGFTADLQNRVVGDEPWSVESVESRAHRILTLAGLPIGIVVDDTVAGTLLSWVDVDAQGSTGLLQELATSVDGVLWPAAHLALGAYLTIEDPALRESLLRLDELDGVVVIVEADPDTGFDLSACLVLRDSVSWVQDVTDLATRVTVGWRQQTLDDEGNPAPTDATVLIVDAELEAEHGTRSVSVSTQLQSSADATAVANRVMARTDAANWHAEGLRVDDEDVPGTADGIRLLLDLLDGTSRIGAPLILGDLPSWTPTGATAGAYLEGGSYQYIGGRWVLDLLVSSAGGVGSSAAWNELDVGWSWSEFDPSISWTDLLGVAGPS